MPYSETDPMVAISRYTAFNEHVELMLENVNELNKKIYDVKDFDLVRKVTMFLWLVSNAMLVVMICILQDLVLHILLYEDKRVINRYMSNCDWPTI